MEDFNMDAEFPPLSPDWSPPVSLPQWGPPPRVFAWSEGPMKGKTANEIYSAISKYLLTEEERKSNGFPYFLRSKEPYINKTKYYEKNPHLMLPGSRSRTCCRCHQRFVLDHLYMTLSNKCLSHSPPAFDPIRGAVLHPCCHVSPLLANHEEGCFDRNFHVFHHIYESELEKFIQCPESDGPNDIRRTAVYGLDCEMVYTSEGPALARLSLVDVFGNVLIDLLVKPEGKVFDANTAYSGLTLEQVLNATETLESSRLKLFEYVSRDSILIGHSLEADLKALRLIHHKIVDTAILFMIGERRRSLRVLAVQYLHRNIQEQKRGHDSTEDARACIELTAWRLDKDDEEKRIKDGEDETDSNEELPVDI